MKYRKFNKYERKEVRRTAIENAMAGTGTYIFQNSSNNAELTLPRATHSGRRKIGPSEQFQGDSYFLQMVKTGMLRIVEVLQTPEQEAAELVNQAAAAEEALHPTKQEETVMADEKLILDQPDMITEAGKVEHVVEKKTAKQKLNEAGGEKKPDILLNEHPSDDGFIIVG